MLHPINTGNVLFSMKSDTYKQKDSGNIRVADVTLAQLSRGLYRSTATALKELVSNAHDADAKIVRIDTNYPEFDFISCVDDGQGMPLEQFLRFFKEEGVGSCIKRKHGKDFTDIFKRPIIGKLGIGMLSAGQLCHSFEIESHYEDENGEGRAYQAEIILTDEMIPNKDDILRNNDIGKKEIDVGMWKYKMIDYDKTKKGFRIFSSDVRLTFSREMKSSIGPKERERLSFSLEDLHKKFYDKSGKSIRDCKPYLEAIWELAILCPLPYYGDLNKCPIALSSFRKKESESDEFEKVVALIKSRQAEFIKRNFKVIFDGIELERYIQLPTKKETTPKLYPIDFNGMVFESRLKFSGYLFAQVPYAILPLELNGIQIRLKGVGIGGFDSTFLKYYKHIETIRSKWVSGEIFVDNGLESALNIDRDSFNEHDEHFNKLQSILHEKLDIVFHEISNMSKDTHDRERERNKRKLTEKMQNIVFEGSNKKFKLVQKEGDKNAPIVVVNDDKGEIILNTAAEPLKKKKANLIIQSIEVAYHIARKIRTTETERHELFLQLVKEILDEIV